MIVPLKNMALQGALCVSRNSCLVSHNYLSSWQHFAPHSLELVPEEREDVFTS